MNCELEPVDSVSRKMAVLQFEKFIYENQAFKIENWTRLGYKIEYDGNDRIVDATQKYD